MNPDLLNPQCSWRVEGLKSLSSSQWGLTCSRLPRHSTPTEVCVSYPACLGCFLFSIASDYRRMLCALPSTPSEKRYFNNARLDEVAGAERTLRIPKLWPPALLILWDTGWRRPVRALRRGRHPEQHPPVCGYPAGAEEGLSVPVALERLFKECHAPW